MARETKAGATMRATTGPSKTSTKTATQLGMKKDKNKYIVSVGKVKTTIDTVTKPGTSKSNIHKGIKR